MLRSPRGQNNDPGSRVIYRSFAHMGAYARVAAAAALAVLLGSCSSSVSGPTAVEDPTRVTIQPDTAVLYSGMPTSFTVSGGTGTYSITSTNQSVVQVPTFLNGRTFTVTPANVVVDTPVTISVRDSGTAPLASASLTVRPGTVANDIVVIPTETQGGSCSPAVCSGGDALVFATVSQGGNPLPARGVRLDAVSGDFRFIVSAPGQPEVLATTTTVVSDQAGGVHARIRVLPGAANQTGVVQVTDLGTNAFRRTSFSIAQSTGSSPGFFTVPDTFTFTGPNTLQCASGSRADVSIFGGSPPYTISGGGSFFGVSQSVVSASGGSFYVVPNGVCAANVPISVVDTAGRTAVVSVSNVLGTEAVPELLVSPANVTLSDCASTATVTVAGGIPGNFTVSSTSNAINTTFSPSAGVITIARTQRQAASSPIEIGVASGDKVATIIVTLTGDALNTRCDSTLAVIPSAVQIDGCGFADVVIAGGQFPYSATSNSSVLSISTPTGGPLQPGAPMPGNILRINRTVSAAPTAPATVTVFDASAGSPRVSRTVTVSVTGTCP